MKFNFLIARFPYKGTESSLVTDWLVKTVCDMKSDHRIGDIYRQKYDDTPITMTRNKAIFDALRLGVDFLLFVDNDMDPDKYLGKDPFAKPFFKSSFDFMLDNLSNPCVVAAPYCGPPPIENIYIFQWANLQSDHPNKSVDIRLEQFTREEAAQKRGIEEVAALPTGLMLLDMRVFKYLTPPWFEYEYEDPPYNTKKSTTEDVFFTRNLAIAGVKQYCNWDCWAGHLKTKSVGKPVLMTSDAVSDAFRKALMNLKSSESVVEIQPENGPRRTARDKSRVEIIYHGDDSDSCSSDGGDHQPAEGNRGREESVRSAESNNGR